MVSRSVGNPIFVGLGTAAILAVTAAVQVALAAVPPDPSPTASDGGQSAPGSTPTPTPPPTKLYVKLTLLSSSAHGGDSVKASINVWASPGSTTSTQLRLDATANATVSPQQPLYTVGPAGKTRTLTVTVPKSMKTGSITVTAIAWANGGVQGKSDPKKITVTKTPAASPSQTSSSGSGSSSSSGSSGSSGSSSGSTGTSGSTGIGAGLPNVPTSPSSALQTPKVSLPEIPAATPSTVPTMAAAAPSSTLRSGGSPAPQELTFERLASTQAAWLAALLVAFSVLLTQVRLVRQPTRVRPKGDHRRPKHGLFQR